MIGIAIAAPMLAPMLLIMIGNRHSIDAAGADGVAGRGAVIDRHMGYLLPPSQYWGLTEIKSVAVIVRDREQLAPGRLSRPSKGPPRT